MLNDNNVHEEEEIHLQSQNSYYRSIFDRYDRDHNGYISVLELDRMLQAGNHEIPQHAVERIHRMADINRDGRIDFDEFIEMINNPKLQYYFGNYIRRYIKLIVPRRTPLDRNLSTDSIDGLYEDQYSCCPPALGMIIVSIIEVIFFAIDEIVERNSTKFASGPMATNLIYDPIKRYEVWRFITYMFVHIGVFHLVVNLLTQILLGTALEMVHGWWRVLIIYSAGVLAGSLGTSITDPNTKLAGASGGVYSIITAHIATIIMNWSDMTFPFVQLSIFVVITTIDVGTSIYNRYVLDINEHIGYAAHFSGALAGLLVGINVLKNFNITKMEKILWKVSIVVYISLMLTAIFINIFWTEHFP